MKRRVAFIVIVALRLAALAGMIAWRLHLLQTGQRVQIQCQPIDPRSILSGDYVVLNFAISRLARGEVQGIEGQEFREHDRVYVALQPTHEPVARAVAVGRELEPLHRRYPLVLRGEVVRRFYPRWSKHLVVRYGVEQYFVPQREGRRIEHAMRQTSVELAVAASGESAIRRLFVGGQEVTFR